MHSSITIRYFAQFRDLVGKAEETLPLKPGDTAAQIYLRIAETYRFPLALSEIRIAVNDEFTAGSHPLEANDHLVFIPPVSGG